MVSVMVYYMGVNGTYSICFPMSLNCFDHSLYGFEWYSFCISHEFRGSLCLFRFVVHLIFALSFMCADRLL